MIRIFVPALIFNISAWSLPPVGWPPSGNGNTTIVGEKTGGTFSHSLLHDALDKIDAVDHALANEIKAYSNYAGGSGAISITNLTPSVPGLAGSADENTVALDPKVVDPNDLAALLVHEWDHIRQLNGAPGDPGSQQNWPRACQEMAAYAAEANFMCTAMTHAEAEADEHPYYCSSVQLIRDLYTVATAFCWLANGGQLPSNSPSLSVCTDYCAEEG